MGSAVYGVSSMSETPLTDRIPRPGVLELADRQLELYRDLHAHPELSHQETRTANITDRHRPGR